MSVNRFTKSVSTLPMLSSNCSHDNLNLTLHVTTTATVHLLRDNIMGQVNMNR